MLADAGNTDGVTYVADEDCVASVLGRYSDADAAIILATPYDEDPQLSDAGESLSNELNRCIDIDDPSDPQPPGSTGPATTAVPDPNVPIQQQAGDVMVAAFARGVADGEFVSIDEACIREVASRLSDDDATRVVTFGIEEDPGLSEDGLDIFFDVFDCIEF